MQATEFAEALKETLTLALVVLPLLANPDGYTAATFDLYKPAGTG